MASTISKQKNIERLIARCENILSGKAQFQGKEWKLAKVSKPRPVSCISGNSSTRPPAHLPNFTPSHMHTSHTHTVCGCSWWSDQRTGEVSKVWAFQNGKNFLVNLKLEHNFANILTENFSCHQGEKRRWVWFARLSKGPILMSAVENVFSTCAEPNCGAVL